MLQTLGLAPEEQLRFAREARQQFFPFVLSGPVYDGIEILKGSQKKPTDYDLRHHFQWMSKISGLRISVICNKEYLESGREVLHLSVCFFPCMIDVPIPTEDIDQFAAAEVPVLLVPKIKWKLASQSKRVFHFHADVDSARREIDERRRKSG